VRLVLVRHEEPDEDAWGRCYGSLDVGLSPAGLERAARLTLDGAALAAVYTSPARRALDTARPLASAHGLQPVVDERLRELDFGALEGRLYDEVAASEPELYRAWMESPTAVTFPGGESYADLRARVLAALADLRAGHDGATVALVSHGGVLRAVLADCLQLPAEAIFRLDLRHGAVSVVEWLGSFPLVRLVNGPPEAVDW
jgi:alpha-ribazole phosphatase/probable phosphoglycerate mutase